MNFNTGEWGEGRRAQHWPTKKKKWSPMGSIDRLVLGLRPRQSRPRQVGEWSFAPLSSRLAKHR